MHDCYDVTCSIPTVQSLKQSTPTRPRTSSSCDGERRPSSMRPIPHQPERNTQSGPWTLQVRRRQGMVDYRAGSRKPILVLLQLMDDIQCHKPGKRPCCCGICSVNRKHRGRSALVWHPQSSSLERPTPAVPSDTTLQGELGWCCKSLGCSLGDERILHCRWPVSRGNDRRG